MSILNTLSLESNRQIKIKFEEVHPPQVQDSYYQYTAGY